MLNQRVATSGIDPIESTQCYPPTSQERQLPPSQMSHRGFSQEMTEPRGARRRRDEPPIVFVDPNASPPKAFFKQKAEELEFQLAQVQSHISQIEQSAKTAIQENNVQNESKFAQLCVSWQENALINITAEMDVAEQKYREQISLEVRQRQELVDKQLADSDNTIATIQQDALAREAQIRREADETIRRQHVEFEKLKEHAIAQFQNVELIALYIIFYGH